jgi:hypothetical protein
MVLLTPFLKRYVLVNFNQIHIFCAAILCWTRFCILESFFLVEQQVYFSTASQSRNRVFRNGLKKRKIRSHHHRNQRMAFIFWKK